MPIEHQAAHYFLSNFVLLPRTETSRGFLTFLIPLIKNEPPDTQLSTSFTAVALAAFANRPNSKPLLPIAAQYYSKALIHINAALRDPIAAKSDQTITSVLLIGLFEVCIIQNKVRQCRDEVLTPATDNHTAPYRYRLLGYAYCRGGSTYQGSWKETASHSDWEGYISRCPISDGMPANPNRYPVC